MSRKLDALMAEKVMEWRRYDGFWITPDGRHVDFPEILTCDDRSDSAGLPHYSIDAGTAWDAFCTIVKDFYKWAIYPFEPGMVEIEHYPNNYSSDREARSGDWLTEGTLAFALCHAMLWIAGEEMDWETCE